MTETNRYRYLGPRPGSRYRQFFIKGTNTRAERIYRETVGVQPRSLDEVAADFKLPLEIVLECIRYCEENEDLLRHERDEELASIQAHGWDKPPYVPPDYQPRP